MTILITSNLSKFTRSIDNYHFADHKYSELSINPTIAMSHPGADDASAHLYYRMGETGPPLLKEVLENRGTKSRYFQGIDCVSRLYFLSSFCRNLRMVTLGGR
jgi:hypothetical protein